MSAFHGDPAIKAVLLARIDKHLAANTLLFERTAWKDGRGSALGVSIEGTDPAIYAAAFGYPLPLAGALDAFIAFPPETFDARSFARDWVEKVTPGADLRSVPAMLVLTMLQSGELRNVYDDALEAVIALHARDVNADPPTRSEWKQARDLVLRLPDDTDHWKHKVKRMLEAACWTTLRGQSVLVDALSAWRGLAVREHDPNWSWADERRKEAILATIWQDQHALRASGGEPNYAALFESIDSDLSARFVTNLARINRRFSERGAEIAVQCITLLKTRSQIRSYAQ